MPHTHTNDTDAPKRPHANAHGGAIGALLSRRMVQWARILAVCFIAMAASMLYDTAVSVRVIGAGLAVAGIAALAVVSSLHGTARPRILSCTIYLSLIAVWLVIPVSGMEAWLYSEGMGHESAYAATGWKWTYAFCIAGGFAALRLLILRLDFLRLRPGM